MSWVVGPWRDRRPAYVGIGMAVTIGVSFLLVIPIEPVHLAVGAARPALLIGYYANQRGQTAESGPWRRIVAERGSFAGGGHRPDDDRAPPVR